MSYLKTFTREEFEQTIVGCTIKQRFTPYGNWEKGETSYSDRRRPAYCQVVYPGDDGDPSYYAIHGRAHSPERLDFTLTLGHGDFERFSSDSNLELWTYGTDYDRIDLGFVRFAEDPDKVHLWGVNNFRIGQDRWDEYSGNVEEFLEEVGNYITWMDEGFVVNFMVRKQADIELTEEVQTLIAQFSDVMFNARNTGHTRKGILINRSTFLGKNPFAEPKNYKEELEAVKADHGLDADSGPTP